MIIVDQSGVCMVFLKWVWLANCVCYTYQKFPHHPDGNQDLNNSRATDSKCIEESLVVIYQIPLYTYILRLSSCLPSSFLDKPMSCLISLSIIVAFYFITEMRLLDLIMLVNKLLLEKKLL